MRRPSLSSIGSKVLEPFAQRPQPRKFVTSGFASTSLAHEAPQTPFSLTLADHREAPQTRGMSDCRKQQTPIERAKARIAKRDALWKAMYEDHMATPSYAGYSHERLIKLAEDFEAGRV